MRNALLVLSLSLIAACSTGYVPRISTAPGPVTSPTVPVDTAWEPQRPESYDTGHGRMVAVYTNGMVGGMMTFEVVTAPNKSPVRLAGDICTRLGRSGDVGCAFVFQEPSMAKLSIVTYTGKSGRMVIIPMLGDKSRYLVCTGTWTLYENISEAPIDQQINNEDHLEALCRTYALR